MSYLSIFILAIALSVDACVVSFSYGLKYDVLRFKNSMLLALFTGVFQGIMPVFGYFLTNFVREYIQPYAGLIVFLIFSYLGIKFILESFQTKKERNGNELCIDTKCLLLIGVATSIDAFSAGISLSLYGNNILKPALLIAFVTFINSQIGFHTGGRLRHLPARYLNLLAGGLLIFLALKSVV